jgi:hypothetical protein
MMKLTVRHFVRLKSLPDAGFELFLAGFDEGSVVAFGHGNGLMSK